MYFKDIIGQRELLKKIIKAINDNTFSHAQLFTGEQGYGTLQIAMATARYICCTNKQENDSCGKCPSCKKFDKYFHPDVHFVYPVYKKKSTKEYISKDFIKEWRELLAENKYFDYQDWISKINAGNAQGMIYEAESNDLIKIFNFKSYESEYKIAIIWMPEKMNITCSNKLLKLIEEPQGKSLFLLVSEHPEELLTTIKSRTQEFNIKPIEKKYIIEYIKNKYSCQDESKVETIAKLAKGNIISVDKYFSTSQDNNFYLEQFSKCMRDAYIIANFSQNQKLKKQDTLKELKIWADSLASKGRETIKGYLQYAQRLIRENFILNLEESSIVYLNKEENVFSEKFHPFVNNKNIVPLMEELQTAEKHIGQNVNAKIVLFDLALRTIILFKK